MSRFFRRSSSFLKSFTNISAPLCVSFGVASSVPTTNDVPEYVKDVFHKFDTNYHQQLSNKDEKAEIIWKNIKHEHDTKHKVEEPRIEEPTSPQIETNKMESSESEEEFVQIVEETTVVKAVQTEDKQPITASSTTSNQQYLSRFIDHTVLKPKSTESDIRTMCAEAVKYNFFSVCCNPCWVPLCKELLKDSDVAICCVVGFPLGSNTTQIKVLEAIQAVEDGANEIDMVMNVGQAKSGNWEFVQNDIGMVVNSVPSNVAVKVILETCLLSENEIIEACKCSVKAGASFVKTSTGFGGGGATIDDVALMRKCVDEEAMNLGMDVGSVLVKASGGIRDSVKAEAMIEAGANRIGASSGIKIIGADKIDTLVDENASLVASENEVVSESVAVQEQY